MSNITTDPLTRFLRRYSTTHLNRWCGLMRVWTVVLWIMEHPSTLPLGERSNRSSDDA